jgi:hypothetical protein
VLRATIGADKALDASFAPTDAFAKALTPSIKQLGTTINVTLPWLQQLTKLNSPSELEGLLKELTPAVSNTSAAVRATTSLISEAAKFSECISKVLVPTGNEKITVDSSPPQGLDVDQQLFQSAVGLTGATQNFDGNGRYVRATVGGGGTGIKTRATAAAGSLYGSAVLPALGTFPSFPSTGGAPALKSSVPCFTQTAPDLNSATQGQGP